MRKPYEERPERLEPEESTASGPGATSVVARVPQGFDTRIRIRFLPGRDIGLTPAARGCQPRQGAARRDAEPVALPEGTAEKLRAANKRVIEWLARDAANADLFLARPVEALLKAGVELSRAEQKALDRAHEAVREASVVGPGVRVGSLTASAVPTGRVGEARPKPKATPPDGDCGCGPQGKG